MMDVINIDEIKKKLAYFTEVRKWEKYHSPKNLSMALAGEAGELLDVFRWMTEAESTDTKNIPELKEEIANEIADIMLNIIRMADVLDINVNEALSRKIDINNDKYPVDVVKGCAKKYTKYKF